MAETLKRHRESAAWLVLAVGIGYILISLVRLGHSMVGGASFAAAARGVGGSSLGVPMVLVCLAAALACALVRPPSPRARSIVRAAALVVGTAALLEALFLVAGLFGAPEGLFGLALEVLGGVLEIAIKALAASLLWRAARSTPEPEPRAVAEQAEPEQVAPARQASWTADQAVGAVWTRAGDAASGAQASGFGTPGKHSGWDAALAQPELEPVRPAPQRGPWATAGELAADPQTDQPAEPTGAAEVQGLPDGSGTARGGWDPAPKN